MVKDTFQRYENKGGEEARPWDEAENGLCAPPYFAAVVTARRETRRWPRRWGGTADRILTDGVGLRGMVVAVAVAAAREQ